MKTKNLREKNEIFQKSRFDVETKDGDVNCSTSPLMIKCRFAGEIELYVCYKEDGSGKFNVSPELR